MTPINPKILETLNIGIFSEIKSYVFYIEAAKVVSRPSSRQTLLKLAGEEKDHYRILERQHHGLVTSEQWVSYNDILKQDGLPEIKEEMADQHKALIASVRAAKDELTLLEIALKLEEEAMSLFSAAALRAVAPEEKRTFAYLARFEEGHMRLIQGMIDSL
ncbi:MAG: ferritin family protein [candidate division Zixibacteria bacterium]|nr:ferritin family protein [candidate division Zixibacteria bacterium]